MKKVKSPSEFSADLPIGYFSGKNTYEDSIREAKEWADRAKVELIAYFEQLAFGKTILVSYDRKKEE